MLFALKLFFFLNWELLNMFQIQLHIIKLDFWWSEAEARRQSLGVRYIYPN